MNTKSTTATKAPTKQTMLRATEVRERLGHMPKSTFFAYLKQGRLPQPIRLGKGSRATYWRVADLERFEEALG